MLLREIICGWPVLFCLFLKNQQLHGQADNAIILLNTPWQQMKAGSQLIPEKWRSKYSQDLPLVPLVGIIPSTMPWSAPADLAYDESFVLQDDEGFSTQSQAVKQIPHNSPIYHHDYDYVNVISSSLDHDYTTDPHSQYPPSVFTEKSGRPKKGKSRKRKSKISKKTKDKIFSVNKGSFISGGVELPKIFKTAKSCMKACAKMPNCLAGDWNKHSYKCYSHFATACASRTPHTASTHFSKLPCESDLNVPDVMVTHVFIGRGQSNGLLMKKIKTIQGCIKECLTGGGSSLSLGSLSSSHILPQLCFGIDYDFANHKCYLNVRTRFLDTDGGKNNLCTTNGINGDYEDTLSTNSHVVAIVFCAD